MRKSYIYALLVGIMVAWGLNVTALKILVEHFSPVTLTALRIFTAGVVVLLFLWGIGRLGKVGWKEAKQIGLAAMFSVVAHHFFLAVGLTRTTAVNAGLVLGMVPLVTALLAMVFLGQRPTMFRLLGIALGFFGVMFVVANGNGGLGHLSVGDVYVFLAVLAQGISFIMIKKATVDARVMTGWMLIFGSLWLFVLGLVLEPRGLSSLKEGTPLLWTIFLASAVVATALGHMFYNQAVQHLGPAESAVFINLNPFFSLLGAHWLLDEPVSWAQGLGFVLIVAGVVLGSGGMDDVSARFRRTNVATRGGRKAGMW
ncbi:MULTISPECIES: DMT family transporter [Geobacillus]|jgi:drug/metabolite transporter (DMT)-like permease|uniref:DMT family transporter n=2 Tax=Geobacillus thermodenitrificans TaxID=33940 RepID=A0ABY9QIV6_GEOTD|nr:DMT family transporter [Geobacillus thermodenitrificans]ABO68553.1 Putative membrane protein [Geobacillus thermodenitrificans NG80-2]ARP44256.1 putative transporter YbhF [Geobacillus thermodenitrificans]MED3905416.1 DMT family transporter [Geobacillus thermodenitrificans]PTR46334.1 EamA/RhaT family transporter [Geobacillus thermodenitrificans]WMV78161.1 DMT family transporter [Geobacillus thermodenitrificans]